MGRVQFQHRVGGGGVAEAVHVVRGGGGNDLSVEIDGGFPVEVAHLEVVRVGQGGWIREGGGRGGGDDDWHDDIRGY